MNIKAKKVFVVHGRNLEIRNELFRYLRGIGLEPIEWPTAVSLTKRAAPYIGQVLDKVMNQVQAVVVLFTGDDVARLRSYFLNSSDPAFERLLIPQARPNVIFEAGLAFGRHPLRTILVEIGANRPFSDVAGRHTIRLDNSIQAKRNLAQRLNDAGCKIKAKPRYVGNFENHASLSISETPYVELGVLPKGVPEKFRTAKEIALIHLTGESILLSLMNGKLRLSNSLQKFWVFIPDASVYSGCKFSTQRNVVRHSQLMAQKWTIYMKKLRKRNPKVDIKLGLFSEPPYLSAMFIDWNLSGGKIIVSPYVWGVPATSSPSYTVERRGAEIPEAYSYYVAGLNYLNLQNKNHA